MKGHIPDNSNKEERINIHLELSLSLVEKIDLFRSAWGISSRGAIVERLLMELLSEAPNDDSIEG